MGEALLSPHDSKEHHGQLHRLPHIWEIEGLQPLLLPCNSSSDDPQSTPAGHRSRWSWGSDTTARSLERQPNIPLHQQDKPVVLVSTNRTSLASSKHHTIGRKRSAKNSPPNTYELDDGHFAGDSECMRGLPQAPSTHAFATGSPRKRRRESDVSHGCDAILELGVSEQSLGSREGVEKQRKDREAAINHMMMERQRRLDIGDLIRQIASQIKVEGPKVEILKRTLKCVVEARLVGDLISQIAGHIDLDGTKVEILESTVDWVVETKSKIAELDAELEDHRRRRQLLLSERHVESSQAISDSCANAEATFLETPRVVLDTSKQVSGYQEKWYKKRQAAVRPGCEE